MAVTPVSSKTGYPTGGGAAVPSAGAVTSDGTLLAAVAAGTTGNILKDNGSAWISATPAASATNSFTIAQPDAGTSPTASSSTDTLIYTSSNATVTVTGNSGAKSLSFKTQVPMKFMASVSGLFLGAMPAVSFAGSAGFGAIGSNPLPAATQAYSTYVWGESCATGETRPVDLVAIGDFAAQYYFGRFQCVGIGSYALQKAYGTHNTAVGYGAMVCSGDEFGTENTAFGDGSLSAMNGTNNQNTAIGRQAGNLYAAHTKNTFVGYKANAAGTGQTNSTAVGTNAIVPRSNFVQLGDSTIVGFGAAGYWETTAITTPATPAAGLVRVYIDSATGKLARIDSTGTVVLIG